MLSVRNLSRRFGGLKAISNVSFDVEEGEFVGVIGPNGAGKTTLLNLLTGYTRPSEGEILLDQSPVHMLRPSEICHRRVARTFQIVRPFAEMSVLDNVMVGTLFASDHSIGVTRGREEAAESVRIAGLWEQRAQLAGSLTIGQKKRLELARALATRPKLLLLDEVLAGLTRAEVDQLVNSIRAIGQRGVTVIMIEHLVHVILRLCRRVIVLNFGEVIFDGPTADAMDHPEVVRSYLGRPLQRTA